MVSCLAEERASENKGILESSCLSDKWPEVRTKHPHVEVSSSLLTSHLHPIVEISPTASSVRAAVHHMGLTICSMSPWSCERQGVCWHGENCPVSGFIIIISVELQSWKGPPSSPVGNQTPHRWLCGQISSLLNYPAHPLKGFWGRYLKSTKLTWKLLWGTGYSRSQLQSELFVVKMLGYKRFIKIHKTTINFNSK